MRLCLWVCRPTQFLEKLLCCCWEGKSYSHCHCAKPSSTYDIQWDLIKALQHFAISAMLTLIFHKFHSQSVVFRSPPRELSLPTVSLALLLKVCLNSVPGLLISSPNVIPTERKQTFILFSNVCLYFTYSCQVFVSWHCIRQQLHGRMAHELRMSTCW